MFTKCFNVLLIEPMKTPSHRVTIRFRPSGKFPFPDRQLGPRKALVIVQCDALVLVRRIL